jgi:hypothetical protein
MSGRKFFNLSSDALACLFLLAYALCFHSRYIVAGKLMLPEALPNLAGVSEGEAVRWNALQWDGAAQYLPWRHVAKEMLKKGIVPLWNSHQGCGMPLLANPQVGVFYPLNLLLWFAPIEVVSTWLAILHMVIALLSTYYLSRALSINVFGSLACALSYAFCAPMISWQMLPTAFNTMSWFPCALLCVILQMRTPSLLRLLTTSGVCTMLILSGHPQLCIYALISLCIVSLMLCVFLCSNGVEAVHRFASVIIAIALAISLSASQLLPTMELSRYSHRYSAPTWDGYYWFALRGLSYSDFIMFLLPYAWGKPQLGTYIGKENFSDYCPYVGVVALVLAFLGVVSACERQANDAPKKRMIASIGLSLLVVGLLMATGSAFNIPFYFALPGFAQIGTPTRALFVSALGIAMLCAIGFEWLSTEVERKSVMKSVVSISISLACLSCIFVLLLLMARFWAGISHMSVWEAVVLLVRWNAGVVLASFLFALAMSLLWLLGRFSLVIVISSMALELVLFGIDYNQALSKTEYEKLTATLNLIRESVPEVVDGLYRILPLSSSWGLRKLPKALLPPNTLSLGSLSDPQAYDSLMLRSYKALMEVIEGAHPCPLENGNMVLLRNALSRGLLPLVSVRYILTTQSQQPKQMESTCKVRGYVGRIVLYELRSTKPRAFVPKRIAVCNSGERSLQLLKRLKDTDFAVVTCASSTPKLQTEGFVKCMSVRDEGVILKLLAVGTGGCALVLNDTFYPGWKCWLIAGGNVCRELQILPAQYALRCVFIPRFSDYQRHCTILFAYVPTSYLVGSFISLISCSLVAGFVCCMLTRVFSTKLMAS